MTALPARPGPLPRNDIEAQRAVIAALHAASRVLAVRLALMLALVGGFVLAVMAIGSPAVQALFVLIAYGVLIMLPVIWLEHGNAGRG